MTMVTWKGSPPRCEVQEVLALNGEHDTSKRFVDGKLNFTTSWGMMCENCHKKYGVGLGTGLGQKYEKQSTGKYRKIEG